MVNNLPGPGRMEPRLFTLTEEAGLVEGQKGNVTPTVSLISLVY